MKITRTYWRDNYNRIFKAELADPIGSFAIKEGKLNRFGAHVLTLNDPIDLPTTSGETVKVETIRVKSKIRMRRGYADEIPTDIVVVLPGSEMPIKNLTVDAMMLLLDAIDQQVVPDDGRKKGGGDGQ